MAQGRTYLFGWVAVACILAAAVLGYFTLYLKGLAWGAISTWACSCSLPPSPAIGTDFCASKTRG